MIFIDDYFNCLTVGSVMRPVTDKHKVSRAKLAYIIDATAAPICIIAPISSWAAAVAGFAEDGQGLNLFIKAIPFNFYALLTILMLVFIVHSEAGLRPHGPLRAQRHGDRRPFLRHEPLRLMMDEEVERHQRAGCWTWSSPSWC